MDIDLKTWGPVTVFAVVAGLLLIVGGLIEVVTTPYTFHAFLDDLKPFAAAAVVGSGVGRGIRLHSTPVTTRARRR